jgi:hypothetical protein
MIKTPEQLKGAIRNLAKEKVIRKNLDENQEQMDMIDRLLDEMLPASKKN